MSLNKTNGATVIRKECRNMFLRGFSLSWKKVPTLSEVGFVFSNPGCLFQKLQSGNLLQNLHSFPRFLFHECMLRKES